MRDFEQIWQEAERLWQADRDYWFFTVYTRYCAPILSELEIDTEAFSADPFAYGAHGQLPIRSRPREPEGEIALQAAQRLRCAGVEVCRGTLMPNHVHLLLSCPRGVPPKGVASAYKAAVTRARNRHYGQKLRRPLLDTHLLHPVSDVHELREILSYMQENPTLRYYRGRK